MASFRDMLMRRLPRAVGPLVVRCRLCWQITLAVFLGIVVIEAAILVPSVTNYERDRLAGITETGRQLVASTLTGATLVADREVNARLERVLTSDAVTGLELTTSGGDEIMVGEDLATEPTGNDNLRERRDRLGGDRMEVAWTPEELDVTWSVQARLNTETIDDELTAFVARIAGLVLLITAFVTVVTMSVLGYLVLKPLFELQHQVTAAAADPDSPDRYQAPVKRADEVGALTRAFNSLLAIISQRLGEIRALNADLDRRVAERTKELEAEIAERRDAEARAQSLARFPQEDVNPVLRVDSDCCLTYANNAAQSLLDYGGVGIGERLPDSYCRLVEAAMASGEATSEEVFDGKHWFLCTVVPVPEDGYANIYGTDITERKEYEETLQNLAYHDSLTGLPNRNAFIERLEGALADCDHTGSSTGVLFVGLDGFRTISGTAGHDAGDRMLQEVARRLSATAPQGATVARLSGDVFAVLIPACAPAEVASLETAARLLIDTVDQPVTVDHHQLRCGASVGISVYPQDAEDAPNLGKNADLALYRAKQSGGNSVAWFDKRLLERAQWRQERARGLRRALDDGELLLHYQPQLDTAEGLVGVEALMRWQAPGEGLVSPGDFIPVAEETGLIAPMGDWALEAACAQAQAWRQGATGPAVTIAVNLAAPHLLDTGLPDRVSEWLAAYGLPPSALELEVTESAVMADMDAAIDVLERLAALGVTLAVDDFGTGYSSLAYLKRLPVHRLKIDRAFVTNLPEDTQDAALCRAILELGRSLELAVVAEGVETRAQFDWLRARGCDIFQGFYFAKPMPGDELAGWATRTAAAASG